MKTLVMSIFVLLSFNVLAKDFCPTGHCLKVEGHGPFYMVNSSNQCGEPNRELNQKASFFDLMGIQENRYFCYQGSIGRLQESLKALIDVTNREYQRGGNYYIQSHHGYSTSEGYQVVVEFRMRATGARTFIHSPEIKECY